MKPQPIRGMNDILPDASATWRYLEAIIQEIVESYGYRQIRLPILEQTGLFARSIGEATAPGRRTPRSSTLATASIPTWAAFAG